MARILIIEDNAANLALMSYLLTAHGHTVDGARDGMSGFDAVIASRPDLVLCDIQLPKLSGYEIARALRSEGRYATLPLVAVTAMAMRGDREQVLQAGFSGYIEKPIQPEAFVGLVEAFLPESLRTVDMRPAAAAAGPRKEKPKSVGKLILVVDDVSSNIQLMHAVLEHGGYRVRSATSMTAALEVLDREAVDLVISDIHMPAGDGFDLCRLAARRPRAARVPFLFISSSSFRSDERETAGRLGVRALLERPVEPGFLLDAVRESLAATSTRAA
jgi:two-component system cell cycle response regulator